MLSGSATLGVGALAVACGGSSNSKGSSPSDSQASALLYKPQDTSATAKTGGTYLGFLGAEPASLDPRGSINAATLNAVGHFYSRLFKQKPGILKPSDGSVEPDLVDKYELTSDGLQLSIHLRKEATWDSRSPTNGRALDAQDVRASWDNFAATHPSRTELSYAASKSSPIDTVTVTDSSTLVFKLAFPFGALLTMLASGSHLWILPKEAGAGYDPRGDERGTGPWRLVEWRPSSSLTFEKNAAWYLKGRPFMDRVEYPIIPEYATQLAQFRAGRIATGVVRQEDLLSTKRDLPSLLLTQLNIVRASTGLLYFGFADSEKTFRDDRVRQAFSLAIDRQAFTDFFFPGKDFTAAGLPIDERFHSHLHAGEPLWSDPTGKDLGDGAQYFGHDVAKAKQLLAAAGFTNGLDSEAKYAAGSVYGTTYPQQVEVTLPMLAEAGIRGKATAQDYNTEYTVKTVFAKGDHTGFAMGPLASYPDPGEFLFGTYHPDGTRSKLRPGQDPELQQRIETIRREIDANKRASLIKDAQKYMAVKMWAIPWPPGVTGTYALSWPWLQNYNVFKVDTSWGSPTETLVNLWIDPSKQAS